MEHDYGKSICVSSQIGCNMGCAFCESGRLKKVRNLTSDEMLLQVLKVEEDIKSRISHVVIMGIGEPFDNYDNVLDFIKIINNDKGMAIGARHITVSTCGIIPKIEAFMKENLQVNLAISLHGADNETRGKLMPINKVYDIDSLIDVLKKYVSITNRRLTFEYILLDNVNDIDKEWASVNWEEVVKRNPDVIIIHEYRGVSGASKIAQLKANPLLQEINAVKNNRFIIINLDEVYEGVRNAETVEKFAQGFYPEKFY